MNAKPFCWCLLTLAVVFPATANLGAQTVAKAQEDFTKAREKLDAELKSTQAEKEEMAKALD